jgi:hypothetical protein
MDPRTAFHLLYHSSRTGRRSRLPIRLPATAQLSTFMRSLRRLEPDARFQLEPANRPR